MAQSLSGASAHGQGLILQPYRHYERTNRAHHRVRAAKAKVRMLVRKKAVEGSRNLKRTLDVAGAALALLLFSPVFFAIALAILVEGDGPILFWQTRTGQWGTEFSCPKFRSMVIDAEQRKRTLLINNQHGDGITFKMKHDPRITCVGRVIRKLSLDELPQLWCVLCGSMSLVGPRPPVPKEVSCYGLQDRRRLDVKPGLTCIWQISGRSELSFDQQVKLDSHYVENYTFLMDLELILRTIPAVISGRGAY